MWWQRPTSAAVEHDEYSDLHSALKVLEKAHDDRSVDFEGPLDAMYAYAVNVSTDEHGDVPFVFFFNEEPSHTLGVADQVVRMLKLSGISLIEVVDGTSFSFRVHKGGSSASITLQATSASGRLAWIDYFSQFSQSHVGMVASNFESLNEDRANPADAQIP